MALTTQQQIYVGRVSGVLMSNKIAGGNKEGGMIDKRWPHLIYAVTEGLEELYTLEPTSADLVPIGNYLISICFGQLRSEALLNLGSGGITTETSTGGLFPQPLDFIVNTTSTPLLTGQTTINLPQYKSYDVEFYRGGQPQYTTNPGDGSTYYTWNRVTGDFTISTAANTGEPFRIVPVGGFATTGATASAQRQPIFSIVGVTTGAPTAGQTTWQNSNFANAYVILFKNGTPVATSNPSTGDAYTTKSLTSDTITISNYAWVANDQLFAFITVP